MVDVDNRWAILVLGVGLVTVFSRLLYVGWLVDLAAFVLGLLTGYRGHRSSNGSESAASS